jgi:hypothetical protein
MTFNDFQTSTANDQPNPNLSPIFQSLWWDKKGSWERAHNIAQDIHTNEGSWIHAYLHRKEGDIWNADYWYRKAGKSRPDTTLDEEWEALVKQFIG